MSADLTAAFRDALRTPGVAFELDRNIFFGGQALVRISVPGPTPRSKRKFPVPVIVGGEGETHPQMLRRLADALEFALAEVVES